MPPVPLGRVLHEFRRCSWKTRAHAAVRARFIPFELLARWVPPQGRLLDVGCGHGLWINYLSLRYPALRLVGIDPDERKIEEARRTGAAASGHEFVAHLDPWPAAGFECVTLLNVLYLLPAAERPALVGRIARALIPGGLLLLRETDGAAGWASALLRWEEAVMVRCLRATRGSGVALLTAGEIERLLSAAGLGAVAQAHRREGHSPELYFAARKGC